MGRKLQGGVNLKGEACEDQNDTTSAAKQDAEKIECWPLEEAAVVLRFDFAMRSSEGAASGRLYEGKVKSRLLGIVAGGKRTLKFLLDN